MTSALGAMWMLLAGCALQPVTAIERPDDTGDSAPDTDTEDTDVVDTDDTDAEDTAVAPDTDVSTWTSADIVPLYGDATTLEPEVWFERGDAIVTRFADRARDRHAREDEFQSYDHYLPRYWEHRTVRVQLVDTIAKGGDTIEVTFVSEWKLSIAEFRAWYRGTGSVATYSGNYAPQVREEGPGTFDDDLEQVSDAGAQYRYTYTIDSAYTIDGANVPLAAGQFMEVEISQFLDGVPSGRSNYYGTALLYAVGTGGVVPWEAVGTFSNAATERENSHPLDEAAWLGGRTTLPYNYSDEPGNAFMQMASNLSSVNGQAFVRGRRVHHTDMADGTHDESDENGIFTDLVGLVGPNSVNTSCDSCHTRNGRAPVAEVGVPLDKWVFKVAAADGGGDPAIGHVLQPSATTGGGEGEVSIAAWVEADGLRSPRFAFSADEPALYSARLAPALVGMGLLEAVPESAVLAWEDPDDTDGDGVSGRAQLVADPATGDVRLGRFGWKAGASSVTHQVAGALNTDMGVMTSLLSTPDCGAAQAGCGNDDGAELADAHLLDLVKYISLLGVRARTGMDDADALQGEALFGTLGCAACHVAEVTTTDRHPFAELRGQVIHPYTDLLLHDMGEGLASTLGEGRASGAEWRTAPLWGLGANACVTGGTVGPAQDETCAPDESYLHDGRARTLAEAILWHGGEGEASRAAYAALSEADREAVLTFLGSL